MAQIKLLKIGALGLPEEMDSAADDITLLSYVVTGGGPVLAGTGLDLNNQDVSDIKLLSFNDPTAGSIVVTSGTRKPDDLMFDSVDNTMETTGSVLFPVITDVAGEVDSFRLPQIAGVPTATPTVSGEGFLVWDSTGDRMFAWTGSVWDDLSSVSDANRLSNVYTAGVGGVTANDILYISAADTVLKGRSNADATSLSYIGFARTTQAAAASVDVVSEGLLSGFTGLTAGSRYYMSAATAGLITATAPSGAGNLVIQAGVAKNATNLHIRFQFIGKKAL